MYIAFWYECGEIEKIGMGHRYRSMAIAKELEERGHKTICIENSMVIPKGPDVIVIDHISPALNVAAIAKSKGIKKAVVIDGQDSDADVHISAFCNYKAEYKGKEYISFPTHKCTTRYDINTKSKCVFVSVGGYDKNNHARKILEYLEHKELDAIVAKSINHVGLEEEFPRATMFAEDNYYKAMAKCVISITNGGLSMFQSLFYGMPTIAIHQYSHQGTNIQASKRFCLWSNIGMVSNDIDKLVASYKDRESLSEAAQKFVDGKGIERICDIIETI